MKALRTIRLGIGSVMVAAVLMVGCKNAQHVTPLPGNPEPGYSAAAPMEPEFERRTDARAGLTSRRQAATSFGVGFDEVWVVAREKRDARSAPESKDVYGSGELRTRVADEEVPLPLKHTDVRASVAGYIGTVDVKQQFHNPYNAKIEAVYVFPLPHDAAVSEFVMTIGDRRIRGIIRERKEAEEIYRQARSQGHVTSLLTQERPNIFLQSVANIESGRQIDVNIKYFQTLAYADGWYEFVFPMVVGPRYNPPGSTTGVGAVPRGITGVSGQRTEIPYLRPNERSGHDIDLHLEVDAGVQIEEFTCATHRIDTSTSEPERVVVALDKDDRIPNKDFVFRYRVTGERIKSNLIVHHGNDGGYFTMMLFPPKGLERLHRAPLELVFVLDCSGSMSGKPIEQAKAAIRHALEQLEPGDSFQIINFSERASRLGRTPLEATTANIRAGLRYVDALNGDGPTKMIEGIKAALDFPHDPERLRFVCFLTDGYIGNETEILGAVHERLGESRIFSFGVGSSPNRYLLDHLARMGQGAVAYLGLNDDGAKVMDDFFERISHPALTDIEIDWGTMRVTDVYPGRMPDLFVGRPVVLTGRFAGDADGTIRVTGRAGKDRVTMRIPARRERASAGTAALPNVWARTKIAELGDRMTYSMDPLLSRRIKQLALDYGLMSAYTAFVAVDSSRRTEGTEGVIVPVAVPVPEGVKYSTTVEE